MSETCHKCGDEMDALPEDDEMDWECSDCGISKGTMSLEPSDEQYIEDVEEMARHRSNPQEQETAEAYLNVLTAWRRGAITKKQAWVFTHLGQDPFDDGGETMFEKVEQALTPDYSAGDYVTP